MLRRPRRTIRNGYIDYTGLGTRRRRYGFWAFVFDCLMTVISCGFWIIWIFVREMRGLRR